MDIGRIPPVQSAVPEIDPPEASQAPEAESPNTISIVNRSGLCHLDGHDDPTTISMPYIPPPPPRPQECILDDIACQIPHVQETEDGFVAWMEDPYVWNRDSYQERRYEFYHQGDGSYIYRDPDGVNWVIIHADGRMEDSSTDGCGILPFVSAWEDPVLSPRRQLGRAAPMRILNLLIFVTIL